MTKRQTPPWRNSKRDVVVVKPFGPHHCARCFASVHAANTSSRGAPNSRMPASERGSGSRSRLLFTAMFFALGFRRLGFRRLGFRRFGLQHFQIGVEAIKTLLEEPAIVFEPIVDILQRLRLDTAGAELRFARARDQAGALQYPGMLGQRREGPWRRGLHF